MPYSPSYIKNVQTGPYAGDEQEIARKRKMAEMLQAQSMEAPPMPSQGALSPLHILAKGLQAYKGKQAQTEADTKATELGQRQQSERSAALAAALRQGMGAEAPAPEMGGGPAMPANPAQGMATLAQSGDPQTMSMGMGPLQAMQAQQKQQQDQQFRASESAEARAAREAQANQQRQFMEQQAAAQRAQQADMARLTASLRPNPADQNRPPAGYRPTPEGNLQAIPGGPADLKLQGAMNKDTATLQSTTGALDRLAVAANEVMTSPGLGRITGLAGMAPNVPGFAGADTAAKLQTLKAQVGFNVLQEMRNASKTGGALGQVTEKELGFLQNALAAIDTSQSESQMKESLQKIIDYASDAKVRLNQSFNMTHGGQQPSGSGWATDKERRYQEWKARQSK